MTQVNDIIILPTYPPHFRYAIPLLDQYYSFIKPSEQVDVYIVFSNVADYEAFIKQIAIKFWRDMFKHVIVDHDFSIKNKFLVQTYKKFYAMQNLSYKRALIIDSDTSILRTFNMKDFIAKSSFNRILYKHKFYHPFDVNVMNTSREYFGFPLHQGMYFEEPWIVRKDWVMEFFNWWLKDRCLFEVMSEIPVGKNIFDMVAYNDYLLNFKRDEIIVKDSDEILAKYGIDTRKGEGFVNFNIIVQHLHGKPEMLEKLAGILKDNDIVVISGSDFSVNQLMKYNEDVCIRLHIDRVFSNS